MRCDVRDVTGAAATIAGVVVEVEVDKFKKGTATLAGTGVRVGDDVSLRLDVDAANTS